MEVLINIACITAVAGFILLLTFQAGWQAGSYEASEIRSHYRDIVSELVRRGYAEAYPYNDPDSMPSELREIEWKEGDK